MDTGPKGAITALEILENQDIFEPSLLQKWGNPFFAASLALVSSLAATFYSKKPAISGVQRHALVTIGAFFAMKFIDKKHDERLAERDAGLREYVRLHPEEFPPIERVKFKNILEPWHPVRT